MPHKSANGIELYYELHGDAGSPLILIAGFGASSIEWPPETIQDISKKHRVVLFDNRGVGQSERVAPPYSMAQYAADAVGLLDALGIQQAHVLGYSMGGMIAQHVALDHPNRLLSLTLCACGPGGPQTPGVFPPAPEVLAQLAKPPSENRAEDIREGWWIGYTQAYIDTHQAQLERNLSRKLAYPEPDAETLQGQVIALATTHDTVQRLPEIGCPTLIQTGTEDILVPPGNSLLMAERIPQTQLRQYPNCAHGFFDESEGAAITDLLAFLKQVDSTHQSEGRL